MINYNKIPDLVTRKYKNTTISELLTEWKSKINFSSYQDYRK